MKRAGNLYHLISDYENLCKAFVNASRGKHGKQEVINFKKDFAANIAKLRHQIQHHDFSIGHYRFFQVLDPKPREICAASFQERVLHHAIMNICEPVMDSYMIHDSYACRTEKGNVKAVIIAHCFTKCFPWYLKLDIKKYFDSIDHSILMRLLSDRIKDKNVLLLFQKLLATYHTTHNKGLPIGNLISQHCANFYLGVFDHWIKEVRLVKGYVRYMDDFLIFGLEKSVLKQELGIIQEFLANNLSLRLKENIQLNKCRHGIPFLGYRIFPDKILLGTESRKRFIKKFPKYESNLTHGVWSINRLVRHMEPLIEFTRNADAREFRNSIITSLGVLS